MTVGRRRVSILVILTLYWTPRRLFELASNGQQLWRTCTTLIDSVLPKDRKAGDYVCPSVGRLREVIIKDSWFRVTMWETPFESAAVGELIGLVSLERAHSSLQHEFDSDFAAPASLGRHNTKSHLSDENGRYARCQPQTTC